MKSRSSLFYYWKHPPEQNQPQKYLANSQGHFRSAYLLEMIMNQAKVKKNHSILELGCNSGRNLNLLKINGYEKLFGVEINRKAVEMMEWAFGDSIAKIYVGAIEDRIKLFSDQDFYLVFTMAVLVHIHPSSKWIFEQMVRITKKYIITIEDECTNKDFHIARKYQDIFEGLGMKQIFSSNYIPGANKNYYARIFSK